ncbi:hypothetical protein [Qaidamihabitans albus]|uniref:hypothetical protein n=1 Tax=Qaidamihabitans albus TaxID=2795733 RepID=UPI0018F11C0C|nr:hypothetical protein [Qaidamihabitans albus]
MNPVLWVLAGIVVFVLLPALAFDLRARRRGHRFRRSGAIAADVRETRRDHRAARFGSWLNEDHGWTAANRRNRPPGR